MTNHATCQRMLTGSDHKLAAVSHMLLPLQQTPYSGDARCWRHLQRSRLAEIEDTIAHLASVRSDVPRSLETERKDLQSIVSTFSYPISTVPVEIIRQIFIQCLPADGRVQPLPHLGPLILIRICRRWRAIALGTFELWASFDFTFHGVQGQPDISPWALEHTYAGTCNLLRTWFSRANGVPLSLTLRCSESRGHFPNGFLEVISQFSHQFWRIEISIPRGSWRDIRRYWKGPFTLLSHLCLHVSDNKGWPVGTDLLPALANMPRLRDLQAHVGFPFPESLIGAAPLTGLYLTRPVPLAGLSRILKSFPALLHLKVSIITPVLSSALLITELPPLKSFSINTLAVLEDLTLPHLRSLSVPIPTESQIPTLLAFLTRSACTLRELALRPLHVDDAQLVSIFHATPSVSSLRLDFSEITADVPARSIYRYLAVPALLPALRDLFVVENLPEPVLIAVPDDQPSYRYGALIRMLLARNSNSLRCAEHRLNSFALTLLPSRRTLGGTPIEEELVLPRDIDVERLAPLQNRGLSVRVDVLGTGIAWPSGASKTDDVPAFPAYNAIREW